MANERVRTCVEKAAHGMMEDGERTYEERSRGWRGLGRQSHSRLGFQRSKDQLDAAQWE